MPLTINEKYFTSYRTVFASSLFPTTGVKSNAIMPITKTFATRGSVMLIAVALVAYGEDPCASTKRLARSLCSKLVHFRELTIPEGPNNGHEQAVVASF